MSYRYKPCDACPFTDPNQLWLNYERKAEIVAAIRADHPFHCHKTVDYSGDEGQVTEHSQECAGALILQEREGSINQLARIAERLGLYDPTKLDMELVPYPSFDDWVEAVPANQGGD